MVTTPQYEYALRGQAHSLQKPVNPCSHSSLQFRCNIATNAALSVSDPSGATLFWRILAPRNSPFAKCLNNINNWALALHGCV
jgi:hypothetical protein